MSFIRAKRIRNNTYYYLVKNKREGKKVRQKVIKYLGTEPPTGKRLEEIRKAVEDFEKKLNAIKKPPTKEQIKKHQKEGKNESGTLR